MAKHSETRKYMVKNGKIYTAKARKTSLNNKEMNDFGNNCTTLNQFISSSS